MVVGVIRVFGSSDVFAKIGATAKQKQQQDGADDAPVDPSRARAYGEQIKTDPDALLSGIVGVTHVFPQAGMGEALFVDRKSTRLNSSHT